MGLNTIKDKNLIHFFGYNVDDVLEQTIEKIKDNSYKKGLEEAACRLQMIACVVPESITKKDLLRMIKREVEVLEKKING